ncbi:calpain-type cysteine protease DEK1 [Artemisia annua]|uniref:Calpain-type cysteine protease DEK1 n=1 Tax=Artemisia annua TaxID=35608 RepID=A0A2U1PF81_ARTAN|nr:calpain-type cysteine protease DEK1 [Artemisia annua]
MATDRGIIPITSPYRSCYWYHPLLAFKQLLLNKDANVCLFFPRPCAFFVGWYQGRSFARASVGYFSFLFLLAGRALTIMVDAVHFLGKDTVIQAIGRSATKN